MSRQQFESLTADLLQRTHDMTDEALDDAGMSYAELDRVLLVGGSTRMPMVGSLVRRITGKEPELSVDPDETVALGAAIQADLAVVEAGGQGLMLATDRRLVVQDVTSHGLGTIAVEQSMGRMKEYNSIIIPHNSKVPTKRSEMYETVVDDQTELDMRITVGDDRDIAYVDVIGDSRLTIPPYPAGAPIEVVMS